MKTNIRTLVFLLIATLAGAVAASGQAVSLADIGHDVFKSDADGFEIAVPHDCFKVTPTETGRAYVCDLKEGRVVVIVDVVVTPINTDEELAMYLAGFGKTLGTQKNVKVLRQTPTHLGDYRGAAFQLTVDGNNAVVNTLCWGKSVITMSGEVNSTDPNAGKLIDTAVQSFALTAKPK